MRQRGALKRLLRPSTLMIVLGLIVIGAAAWIMRGSTATARPEPVAVADDALEIVWLYSATSAPTWRRFVQAVEQITGAKADEKTFPAQSTAVPELRATLPGSSRRLVFRWYKLTSQWKIDYWVKHLLQRDPPPLAIIGGANSDQATLLAKELQERTKPLATEKRPLLLLTTATAEKTTRSGGVPLMGIYPDRTFRFSFTNDQMCDAVLDFVWSRDQLRPDPFPYYPVYWSDDTYSQDLFNHFRLKLGERDGSRQYVPLPYEVPWSVGSFDRPNHHEARSAAWLLDALQEKPPKKRPLLILPGQAKPARRFLRGLFRLSPMQARKFVVVTGDAISFNTIYRDSDTSWPIQDVPCDLVCFSHHNPIDRRLGFGESGPHRNGTNDLQLYRNVVRALTETCGQPPGAGLTAGHVRDQFHRLRLGEDGPQLEGSGPLFFTNEKGNRGNRRSGTGERVIWLRPHFRGERVLPEATITVWSQSKDDRTWQASQPLKVLYVGAEQ